MFIYLDESGAFATPSVPHKISCVAALVIPDRQRDHLLAAFQSLEASWPRTSEAKGSKLSEFQTHQVIELLHRYDVLFDVVPIDMGLQTDSQTSSFKSEQARRVIRHVNASYPASFAQELQNLHDGIVDLSNQLFIQAFLTIILIERVLQTVTMYFVQRSPSELGAFHWVADGKDIGTTKYERLWRNLILPLVQSHSVAEPFKTLQGADYSSFTRFFVRESDLPEHLNTHASGHGGINLKLVLDEDFILGNSKTDPGLRLADVVASSFTRALNGKLGENGWRGLGSLLVARNPETIQVAHLHPDGGASISVPVPYARVVKALGAAARSMFP